MNDPFTARAHRDAIRRSTHMTRFCMVLVSVLCTTAVAGCAAVQPGRSAGRQLDDFNASLSIKSTMLRSEGYALNGVDVEITEGVALLTGEAPRDADRVYAECVTWSAPSVRSVVNEITVGGGVDRTQMARDALITQQVRGRLLGDSMIRSVNFNIEAHAGEVYLLGFARSEDERERAAAHAALVPGVTRVVDLVRTRGETDVPPARGALAAAACEAAGGAPVQP